MLLWTAPALAFSARDAWGHKPVLAPALAGRDAAILACGFDEPELATLHRLADETMADTEAWRRRSNTDLRDGRSAAAPLQRAAVAALAAHEADAAAALAGPRLGCLLDVLDAAWAEDRARSAPHYGETTVTYNVYATQYDANTDDEVAVPDECIKFANLGWETCSAGYASPQYYVELNNGGNLYDAWVGDVGPWNVDDNYWDSATDPDRPRRLYTDLAQGYNESRAAYYDDYNGGEDQYGREVSNPAGIDLAPTTAGLIGLGYLENAWIDVTWLWEATSTWPNVSLGMAQTLPADQPGDSREGDGIPDLYPGQTWTVTVTVANTGSDTAGNVTLGAWVETPYLTAESYTTSTGATVSSPGGDFDLALGDIGAGGAVTVTFTLQATEASVGLADHPDLRVWVGHIDGYYEKADFDSAPSVNAEQTWNGGDLRAYVEHDVWPLQTSWTWDDGSAEGWWAANAVGVATGDGTLRATATGDDPQIVSPWLAVPAATYASLVWVGGHYGDGTATLYWSTLTEPGFSEDRSVTLRMSQNAAAEDYVEPAWTGLIDRLRIDPGPDVSDSVVFDELAFGGPGGATVDEDAAGVPGVRVPLDDVGCGCGGADDSAAPPLGADTGLPGTAVPLGDVGACASVGVGRVWILAAAGAFASRRRGK